MIASSTQDTVLKHLKYGFHVNGKTFSLAASAKFATITECEWVEGVITFWS